MHLGFVINRQSIVLKKKDFTHKHWWLITEAKAANHTSAGATGVGQCLGQSLGTPRKYMFAPNQLQIIKNEPNNQEHQILVTGVLRAGKE